MNNNIQCSIESSTTKIELNSAVDGVFLVPELEGLVGLPEIRTTSGVNAGYDGGWTSAQNYDARLISIRGVIANPDISKVEDKRRAIASLLGQGRKEQLTLRFTTEAGNAYAISVRTISCEMALQRVLTTQEFLIQLRADDPLIYDDGATGGIAAILQPQRALGGFEINFGLPLAIGGGAEDTVVDNGNETVYPVIKLYGALHSPTVVNRTTNQQMQILADLQYSIDWHTYRSATGDYILVNDGLNGAPMTLSQLLGNATQETLSGKNMFCIATSGDKRIGGLSFTIDDGVIHINGTTTRASYYYFDTFHVPNSGSAILSMSVVGTIANWTNAFGIRVSDDGKTWSAVINISPPTLSGTLTLDSSKYYQCFWYVNTSGVVYNNVSFKVQLEYGSTATAYEPYVGGIPAPNPSYPQPISTVTGEQTVTVTGKNLLDITQSSVINQGTYVGGANTNEYRIKATGNDLFVNAASTAGTPYISTRGNLISCNYGETIYFNVGNNNFQKNYFTEWDENLLSLGYTLVSSSSGTYTPTKQGCKYVNFRFGNGYSVPDTTYTLSPIVCKTSNTSFEPYQGQSYTIDLGSIELAKIGNYQDRIYKNDGKWYIEKQVGKVVLDGTENITVYNTKNSVLGFRLPVSQQALMATMPLCDYFQAVRMVVFASDDRTYGTIAVHNSQTVNILYASAPNSSITTADGFKTWLTSHPTTVYYALATPTTTEITDETLRAQLNFLASLYKGENNISLVGTGAQGEMAISYATGYTVNQDVITIDSQARTITLNGQDVYHLKTSESEFLVLAPGENKLYLTSEVSDDSGYAEVKFKQGYLSI